MIIAWGALAKMAWAYDDNASDDDAYGYDDDAADDDDDNDDDDDDDTQAQRSQHNETHCLGRALFAWCPTDLEHLNSQSATVWWCDVRANPICELLWIFQDRRSG